MFGSDLLSTELKPKAEYREVKAKISLLLETHVCVEENMEKLGTGWRGRDLADPLQAPSTPDSPVHFPVSGRRVWSRVRFSELSRQCS